MNINNPIHKKIYDSVIKPALDEKLDQTVGTILEYDHKRNKGKVEIINPISGEEEVLSDVLSTYATEGGVFGASLKEGDQVMISFLDGNGFNPRIISKEIIDEEELEEIQRVENGTYVPDFDV